MEQIHAKKALWLLLSFTLLDLCFAGPRPLHGTQEQPQRRPGTRGPHYSNDQGVQRIQFPSLNEFDTQRVEIPSVDAGEVIQRCARGFYRDRYGRCVPCACNGLSDNCDEATGRCLNCLDNTAGHHCERCKDGYYGNAALRTCRICSCPLGVESNNFATGCSEFAGRIQCQCKPGYFGERCERCPC